MVRGCQDRDSPASASTAIPMRPLRASASGRIPDAGRFAAGPAFVVTSHQWLQCPATGTRAIGGLLTPKVAGGTWCRYSRLRGVDSRSPADGRQRSTRPGRENATRREHSSSARVRTRRTGEWNRALPSASTPPARRQPSSQDVRDTSTGSRHLLLSIPFVFPHNSEADARDSLSTPCPAHEWPSSSLPAMARPLTPI